MTIVPPSGPSPCPWMLIGEAPGRDEQIQGRPFVGRSGQALWAALKRVEITRDRFHVRNVISYGLPKNRDPKPAEIAEALPGLLEAVETVNPEVIVTAGGCATRVFLWRDLAGVHGIAHHVAIAGRDRAVFPIYHPAAGLHNKGFLPAFEYDIQR